MTTCPKTIWSGRQRSGRAGATANGARTRRGARAPPPRVSRWHRAPCRPRRGHRAARARAARAAPAAACGRRRAARRRCATRPTGTSARAGRRAICRSAPCTRRAPARLRTRAAPSTRSMPPAASCLPRLAANCFCWGSRCRPAPAASHRVVGQRLVHRVLMLHFCGRAVLSSPSAKLRCDSLWQQRDRPPRL